MMRLNPEREYGPNAHMQEVSDSWASPEQEVSSLAAASDKSRNRNYLP